jgi:hypothetical protein
LAVAADDDGALIISAGDDRAILATARPDPSGRHEQRHGDGLC